MQRVQQQRGRIYAETKNKVCSRSLSLRRCVSPTIDSIHRPMHVALAMRYHRIRDGWPGVRERTHSYLPATTGLFPVVEFSARSHDATSESASFAMGNCKAFLPHLLLPFFLSDLLLDRAGLYRVVFTLTLFCVVYDFPPLRLPDPTYATFYKGPAALQHRSGQIKLGTSY